MKARHLISGNARFVSPIFSRQWTLIEDGHELVTATRSVFRRTSRIHGSEDTPDWTIEPAGWGTLVLRQEGRELARAERQDALGRHWLLTSPDFSYELTAKSMLLRRWTIGQAGTPTTQLQGAMLNFNRLNIDTMLPVPLAAVLLSWHMIVRAWEAAAAAGGGGG